MAPAANNMHCDSSESDTYATSGPLGIDPVVRSRTQGFGGYGTIAFDRTGRIVAVYSNGRRFQLELLDPDTLEELAALDLPPRPWTFPLEGVVPWKYIGAGMYFYLDHEDRAVFPTTDNTIQVVRIPDDPASGFETERVHDLSAHVADLGWPARDSVAWVLPDWSGRHDWWATTGGVIGTVAAEDGTVHALRLEGEIVENSLAVGEDGVFVVSDHALYRLEAGSDGAIRMVWRRPYDRGPGPKPGHITRGSGTSVTLLGGPRDLVAITDNAEPRVHVLFVHRSDGTVACSVPVFPEGRSGTDISVAGFQHATAAGAPLPRYTAVVQNNWGHHSFPARAPSRA